MNQHLRLALFALLATIFVLFATMSSTASAQSSGVTGYDLHIYFFDNNPEQRAYAEKLMNNAIGRWGELRIKMFDKPVGPHPMPMFEIDIPQNYPKFSDIVSWIMVNHGNLSALLHPHTGQSLLDHTRHPLWLGQPVPLDITKL